MIFNRATRAQLRVKVTTDFDPTTATLDLSVDGTWYPATWTGAATSAGTDKWTRSAITTGYFRGPDAVTGGALLAVGVHPVKTRVTLSGESIVTDLSGIHVR